MLQVSGTFLLFLLQLPPMKTTLLSAIIITIVTGALYLFAVPFPRLPKATEFQNEGNMNVAENTQWAVYRAPGLFSLQYPENWQINPSLYGVDAAQNEWNFVLVGDTQPNGAIEHYSFQITHYQNPGLLNCESWVQKVMNEDVEDMVVRGGVSRSDAEDFFRMRYEPVSKETFPYFEACKIPDGKGEDTNRTYFVSAKSQIFSISFPFVTDLEDKPLYSQENVMISEKILESMVFEL